MIEIHFTIIEDNQLSDKAIEAFQRALDVIIEYQKNNETKD